MSENKSSTILLTVIGISTLLVTLVGATFAYFTAGVKDVRPNGAKDDVVITAANLGEINFAHGNTITLDNALPGATDTKEFTISAPNSTVPIDYVIYLDTTVNAVGTYVDAEGITQNRAESDNLVATLVKPVSNEKTTSLLSTATPLKIATYVPDEKAETLVEIGSGTLAAHGSDTWSLTVTLNNLTNAVQNEDQGRSYTGSIVVKAATEYTQQSVYK